MSLIFQDVEDSPTLVSHPFLSNSAANQEFQTISKANIQISPIINKYQIQ